MGTLLEGTPDPHGDHSGSWDGEDLRRDRGLGAPFCILYP